MTELTPRDPRLVLAEPATDRPVPFVVRVGTQWIRMEDAIQSDGLFTSERAGLSGVGFTDGGADLSLGDIDVA